MNRKMNVNSKTFVRCKGNDETINHLFFSCKETRSIYNFWVGLS